MLVRVVNWAKIAFDFVNRFLIFGTCCAIVFIELALLTEILTRRFLGSPQIWVQDTVGFSLFTIAFFSAAWLLKKEQHVTVDIVVEKLSKRSRNLLNAITSILGVIMCIIVVWYSAEVVADHLHREVLASTEVTILKAPFIALITLTMIMLSIQFLRRGYNFWVKWKTSQ